MMIVALVGKKLEHPLGFEMTQTPGWLIGDDNGGFGDDTPCEGDTLSLAARELSNLDPSELVIPSADKSAVAERLPARPKFTTSSANPRVSPVHSGRSPPRCAIDPP